MSRLVVLVWLAGCSFTPGIGPAASAASDASAGNEAGAADARQSHDAAAALDAKLFLDAPPASATGSITVTSALLGAGDTNVSTEGTLDWAHWGYTSATSFDHDNGGASISNVSVVGSVSQLHVVNVTTTTSWTNGTPDASASLTGTGTGINAPGGLRLTVPAGTAPHTLRLYVGGHGSRGRIDVALSDQSASSYTSNQYQDVNAWHAVYKIVYNAASDGQTLIVTWSDEADIATGGFAMLLSATLQ